MPTARQRRPTRLSSANSERRAQQLVAVRCYLLAPDIAVDAVRSLVVSDKAETSIIGLVLTAGTVRIGDMSSRRASPSPFRARLPHLNASVADLA